MIANDNLAYKMHHKFDYFYYAPQNKFTFPFIVLKYETRYTFGKLYDWPIQIHVNERVGYMQQMSIVVTNTCCLGHLRFLFTNPPFCFLTSFCVSSP